MPMKLPHKGNSSKRGTYAQLSRTLKTREIHNDYGSVSNERLASAFRETYERGIVEGHTKGKLDLERVIQELHTRSPQDIHLIWGTLFARQQIFIAHEMYEAAGKYQKVIDYFAHAFLDTYEHRDALFEEA